MRQPIIRQNRISGAGRSRGIILRGIEGSGERSRRLQVAAAKPWSACFHHQTFLQNGLCEIKPSCFAARCQVINAADAG